MRLLALCLLVGLSIAMPAMAAEAPRGGPVHAVVNVDLMPSDEAAGKALLLDHVRQSRMEAGVRSVTLLQQDEGSNHFILIEDFASLDAYRIFGESERVRRFRAALYPHLGSPWDERTGHDAEK
jgi:quinol monooxygenase YgiN